MTYTVHFSPEARRQIQAVPKRDLPRIISLLISVIQEPRRPSAVLCRKASPYRGYSLGDIYVFAIGDYRVTYEVIDSTKEITIAAIKITRRRSIFGRAVVGARMWLSMAK